MKHYLFIFCLFCVTKSEAQALSTNYWAVKWVHTVIATPAFPHIRLAVEKRFGKDAVNVQLGYTIPTKYRIDGITKGTREGYAARLEWRDYNVISPASPDFDFYLGAEIFYIYAHNKNKREYTAYDTTVGPQPTSPPPGYYYKDEYSFTRHTWGAVSKFGLQYRTQSHFVFDFSLGLGFKVYDNKQFYRDDTSHKPNWNKSEHLTRNDQTSTAFTFTIPILGSIGYWF